MLQFTRRSFVWCRIRVERCLWSALQWVRQDLCWRHFRTIFNSERLTREEFSGYYRLRWCNKVDQYNTIAEDQIDIWLRNSYVQMPSCIWFIIKNNAPQTSCNISRWRAYLVSSDLNIIWTLFPSISHDCFNSLHSTYCNTLYELFDNHKPNYEISSHVHSNFYLFIMHLLIISEMNCFLPIIQ